MLTASDLHAALGLYGTDTLRKALDEFIATQKAQRELAQAQLESLKRQQPAEPAPAPASAKSLNAVIADRLKEDVRRAFHRYDIEDEYYMDDMRRDINEAVNSLMRALQ